jgi:vacuolar-type H+-ATPase subunit I/STV1
MTHFRGLQLVFDQQAKRANDAETQLAALTTQLFEEQTANATKQSLIEMREKEAATIQGELVEQRSLIGELQDIIGPLSAMLNKLPKKESTTKRQRDDDGIQSDVGSSKRAKQ